MSKIDAKSIIDLVSSLYKGYKLVKVPDDELSDANKNEPHRTHDFLETSDVSISLDFKNGKPNLNFDTKKHLTKISNIN